MQANKAFLSPFKPENTHTLEHPVSGGKSLEETLSNFKVEVVEESPEELVLDLIGVEAPLANALRRVMIAEIPTMAIEDVHLYQNTSVIPDEVLSHRLGLVPIAADPRLFQYRNSEEDYSEDNSICFKVHVKCTRNSDGSVSGEQVYSSSLEWVPLGNQREKFGNIYPVHPDILIAKLGPGQEIEAELYCEKGTGQMHAKWSPVSTASYRLLPVVSLKQRVKGQEASELKKKCPAGVFDLEDGELFVKNPRNCTSCRECIREDDSKVQLAKLKDHFIFTVESTGVLHPRDIFREALKELKQKASFWIEKIHTYKRAPKNK